MGLWQPTQSLRVHWCSPDTLHLELQPGLQPDPRGFCLTQKTPPCLKGGPEKEVALPFLFRVDLAGSLLSFLFAC